MILSHKAQKAIFCIFILMTVMLSVPASANIWNLPDGLLELFESNKAYESYSSGSKDAMTQNGKPQNIAVFTMENRDHCELFVCRENSEHVWRVEAKSTTAVYQPKDRPNYYPKIDLSNEGQFTIVYQGVPMESYMFTYEEGQWFLSEAKILSGKTELTYQRKGNHLLIESANDNIGEMPNLTLQDFDIHQIPKSADEARLLLRVMGSVTQALPQPALLQTNRKGKLPVYSGPDSNSFRAAKKKASVSLSGDVFGYGRQNGWVMIEYAIKPGKNRIGWVQMPDLQGSMPDLLFQNISALTMQDTFLTDDPHIGQEVLVSVPMRTQVTVKSVLSPWWAYVVVPIGSTTYYGMIPLSSLSIGNGQ